MSKSITVKCKIVGHELVEVKEPGPRLGKGKRAPSKVFDMLKVKMQGHGEDRKTRLALMVDPEHAHRFPLGDTCECTFEVRQGRLGLETPAKSTSATRH